jgi:hypothetical protein
MRFVTPYRTRVADMNTIEELKKELSKPALHLDAQARRSEIEELDIRDARAGDLHTRKWSTLTVCRFNTANPSSRSSVWTKRSRYDG